MIELLIPLCLWGKRSVVIKGVDGVSLTYPEDLLWNQCVADFKNKLVVEYPEFSEYPLPKEGYLATKRGSIVEIFVDEESMNSGFAWFDLDLRSNCLSKRGPLGKLTAVCSPFVLEWNDKKDVKFKFYNDELVCFLNGVMISLEGFVNTVPGSDYYIEHIHDFLA